MRRRACLSTRLIEAIAPRLGLSVHVPPPGTPLQIRTGDGRRFYANRSRFDLNGVRATQVARRKSLCAFHLARLGYRVPEGRTFAREAMADGYRYGRETLGYPFVVKPNVGSLGRGVAVVHNRREYERAARAIFRLPGCEHMLVQQHVQGDDFRIVVLDDDVVAAYRRRPFEVVGDGSSTVRELAVRTIDARAARGLPIEISIDDPRIAAKLARARVSGDDVLAAGVHLRLIDTANLTTGGEGEDLSDRISDDLRRLAVTIARDLGLRFCGIDWMGPPSLDAPIDRYTVIEVNSGPCLDHFSAIGEPQQRRVETIYERILQALVA